MANLIVGSLAQKQENDNKRMTGKNTYEKYHTTRMSILKILYCMESKALLHEIMT